MFKGRLNTDTSPQNFWTTFLDNDLTEKFKKSTVAYAITLPLPLCFSCFVPLRRFRENLTKPFYFHLFRTCDSPGGTPSIISLALRVENHSQSSPRKMIFSILTLMNKYFDIKPLACDHISTGNSERKLLLIGGCFIIFLYGLTFFY